MEVSPVKGRPASLHPNACSFDWDPEDPRWSCQWGGAEGGEGVSGRAQCILWSSGPE